MTNTWTDLHILCVGTCQNVYSPGTRQWRVAEHQHHYDYAPQTYLGTKAYARGRPVGVETPRWVWYATKTLLYAQRKLIVFIYIFLLICRINENTTEWICMQISRNIVNGPKSNNQVLVGIRVIVCIQEPSHYLLQTFRPLHMFKIVFRDISLYPKQLSFFIC